MGQTGQIWCWTCKRTFTTANALAQHTRDVHTNTRESGGKAKPLMEPVCPKCGRRAAVTKTRYGLRAECCGLHSWNLKPLVDEETHRARRDAHSAFDPFWERGRHPRSAAYRALQHVMGMTSAECHISARNAEQASRVVELVLSGALAEELGRT
jgi:hypothetical protein